MLQFFKPGRRQYFGLLFLDFGYYWIGLRESGCLCMACFQSDQSRFSLPDFTIKVLNLQFIKR
jgi:hypothetical protein